LYSKVAGAAGQMGALVALICSGDFMEVKTMKRKGERYSASKSRLPPVTSKVLMILLTLRLRLRESTFGVLRGMVVMFSP